MRKLSLREIISHTHYPTSNQVLVAWIFNPKVYALNLDVVICPRHRSTKKGDAFLKRKNCALSSVLPPARANYLIYVLVSLFVKDERYSLSKDVVSVMVLAMHSTLCGTFLHSLEWKCLNQPHFLYSSLLSSNVCTLLLFIFHEFPSLYLLTSPFLLYKISLVLFHIFNSLNHYLLIQLNFCSSSIFFSDYFSSPLECQCLFPIYS